MDNEIPFKKKNEILHEELLSVDGIMFDFLRNYLMSSQSVSIDEEKINLYFQKIFENVFLYHKSFFKKILMFLFYSYFSYEVFLYLKEKIKQQRAAWLIQECPFTDIAQWDLKLVKYEFSQFEFQKIKQFLELLGQEKRWIYISYQSNKKRIFLRWIRKYLFYFIFWGFILGAVLFAFILGYRQNALTPIDQLRGWWDFLTHKLG